MSNSVFSHFQVCAPTGAGKTNIAMISILHEVFIKFAASISLVYFGDYLFCSLLLWYCWKISLDRS